MYVGHSAPLAIDVKTRVDTQNADRAQEDTILMAQQTLILTTFAIAKMET
jgi:hypothetical protein